MIVGTLVSGVGLGTMSVLTYEPTGRAPETGQMDVPEGSGFNQPRDDTSAALPATSDTPDAGTVPEVNAPEPDDLASLSGDVTEPAAQPQTGTAEEGLSAPTATTGDAGVSVDSEEPVLPSPQSQAPEAPAGEEDLSISSDPAQPAMPDVSGEDAAFPASEVAAAEQDPAVQEGEVEGVLPAEAAGEATVSGDIPADPAPADEPPAADITDESAEAAEDSATMGQDAAAEPGAELPVDSPTIEEAARSEPDVQPDVAEADPVPAERSAEEGASQADEDVAAAAPEPPSTIGDLAPEVKTNRLPSVGDEPEAEANAETADTDPGAQEDSEAAAETEDTRPALEKHAAAFEDPGDKPLMSIVLIDDGSSPVGLQALESFPYPLSFAIPANWDGAENAMDKYRAAGFEVLALTDLPEGSGPQDVEQAMQAIFSVLPEAVAVMEGTGSGLQTSRQAAEQLAPILLDSGHGAVLFPRGLNTAQKLLAREGVPAAAVFRDFDAKGQSATVIRRFLDQAAFKAGQEDAGVVMVGRLRPDTVSALLLWGLQDRANRVALAPISAILRGEN